MVDPVIINNTIRAAAPVAQAGGFTNTDLLYFIISYVAVFVLTIFCVAFFQNGFFGQYFKAKSSRGKKLLIKVRTKLGHYYKTGVINEGFLHYKDRGKEEHTVDVKDGMIYRSLGVNCIDVDEATNKAIDHTDQKEVTGFDAVRFDAHIKRALQKPSLIDKKWQILIALVIVLLLVSLAGVYFNYRTYSIVSENHDLLLKLTKSSLAAVTPGGA